MAVLGVILLRIFPYSAEYGEIRNMFPYLVRMWEKADQKNPEYGHFPRSNDSEVLTHAKYNIIIIMYILQDIATFLLEKLGKWKFCRTAKFGVSTHKERKIQYCLLRAFPQKQPHDKKTLLKCSSSGNVVKILKNTFA